MIIDPKTIDDINSAYLSKHLERLTSIRSQVDDCETILTKLQRFKIAIPSWALSTGGTRFGRFPGRGEPRSLQEKLEDVHLLNTLNQASGAISLHIPWDIPDNPTAISAHARDLNITFDAVNSNTFQDQKDQVYSYKYGSLQHVDSAIRAQAIEHNLSVIEIGKQLGAKATSIWLSDGSNFPGQLDFRTAFEYTLECLKEIYKGLPEDWKMYLEYKCYEPNFYSTTVADWGQALLYTQKLGAQAGVLVDLGHHLPNTNIEQIVSMLMLERKLAGFHFNDSKYGDDDLTVGCINPYQLFLIFHELIKGMDSQRVDHSTSLAWMIDASHNIKDPLEDLIQSVEAIHIAYAQALLIDQRALEAAQTANDVVQCQEILQNAFRTDVRALVAEARLKSGGALDPIKAYRRLQVRQELINERDSSATITCQE